MTEPSTFDPDFVERQRQIYSEEAERYDDLVRYEDGDGRLGAVLAERLGSGVASLLDVGGGTGRVARLVSPHARAVTVLDREIAMLRVARDRGIRAAGAGEARAGDRSRFVQGDARALPFADRRFGAVTAGWSIGHTLFWSPGDAVPRVDAAIAEMERVTRPGGVVIVLESLGTAVSEPAPPSPELAAYYERLGARHGYESRTVATDFVFPSMAVAEELVPFFFGEPTAREVRRRGSPRIPEFTGVWWKRATGE